jgi:hypothetical protein
MTVKKNKHCTKKSTSAGQQNILTQKSPGNARSIFAYTVKQFFVLKPRGGVASKRSWECQFKSRPSFKKEICIRRDTSIQQVSSNVNDVNRV